MPGVDVSVEKEIGEVGTATERDVREGAMAEVGMRNFYLAMGYDPSRVPENVQKATAQAFQTALHGLDLPLLCLEPTSKHVLLLGVDGGKYDKDAATKIIGKFKSLFPAARIISYDSRHTKIEDLGKVHTSLTNLLRLKMHDTPQVHSEDLAEQILEQILKLADEE